VDTIDTVMATADREWQAYGVRRADRAALAADLRLDLESAAADGVGPAQLLGTDVRTFARRLADEAGVRVAPREHLSVLGTALVGAALGAALGVFLMLLAAPLALWLFDPPPGAGVPVQVAVAIYYGVPAAFVVAGAVATVRVRLRDLPYVRGTANAMSVLWPVAGIVITPVTMGFAWTTGFSTSPAVVLAEVMLVAGALAGATVLARRWSLREPAVREPVSAA
jgi:hypothetical protein